MIPSLAIAGTGIVIADEVEVAATRRARMRGLIGRPLGEGAALLIPGARQVHTFGVAAPLDVVFCDSFLRVVHVCRRLGPRSLSPVVWAARLVIEVQAGGAAAIVPEAQLYLRYGGSLRDR